MHTPDVVASLESRQPAHKPDLRKTGIHPDFWYPLARSKQLEKAKAYKLLGKVKVALDDAPGAKAAFREMLSLQPFMELGPKQETPETIKIFKEVRIEFLTANPTTKGAKNWPWIAVSGAVVFTIAALLFFK